MPTRVHNFVGASPNPTEVTIGDDEDGAPPPMPAGGRVTKMVGLGGEVESSSSPQNEADLEARRQQAAAKLAAPRPANTVARALADPSEARALRARCLEIASRAGQDSPDLVIADARRLLDFVENG